MPTPTHENTNATASRTDKAVVCDALVSRFRALSENAYIEYIGCCRRDECLGWEAKVEHGKFGIAELEAHKCAAEWLGRHRAYARAVEELTSANITVSRAPEERTEVERSSRLPKSQGQ